MIDNVATQPPAVANLLTNASPAPASGVAPDAQSAADAGPAESFAATLQSRLKQSSANKPSPRADTENAADTLSRLKGLLTALNADKPANPVAQAALAAREDGENPADAVLAAIAARLGGKDQEAGTAPDQPAAPAADASATLALNVVATTTPPAPALPRPDKSPTAATPAATTAADVPKTTPANSEAPAILAAQGDKNDALPATIDQPADQSFADVMKNTGAVPVAPTHLQPQHAAASAVREIASPLNSSQWSSDVGNQVSWMVSQRESRAELVLNPPQLGRIEVSIALNGDQATASFVSPNADVRDALQGSLPRLREILADAGVFLGQADIGAESSRQFGSGAEKDTKSGGDSISSANGGLLGSAGLLGSTETAGVKRGHGLIDLFA